MKIRIVLAVLCAALATGCMFKRDRAETAAAPPPVAEDAVREITNIAGDLYRFQNNNHYSVFLVTPDGIIATDPINAAAATWLKAELETRFAVPVKYVLYSHHHGDHASGGDVFGDTATFIGHENMLPVLARGDAETVAVRPPDETFENRMTVELGGKSVELYYFGPSHTDNNTVVMFPEERAVYVVDFVTVRRLPFRTLRDSYLPDWINAISRLEELDFDILAPGHGDLGTKQDAADHRQYLEDLTVAVTLGIATGESMETLQETVMLEEYADWGQYDAWRSENIEGAYKILADPTN
jgi:glyoxylase-like metal-dependent hydrolase (beta-lactamase superfamily II)